MLVCPSSYKNDLYEFIHQNVVSRESSTSIVESLESWFQLAAVPSMVDFPLIHQTDKESDPDNKHTRTWADMNKNDGWTTRFYDDDQAEIWLMERLGTKPTPVDGGDGHQSDHQDETGDILWAWRYMKRGVMKADFFRYLVVMFDGGVVSHDSLNRQIPI